jgi:hypothetical protein
MNSKKTSWLLAAIEEHAEIIYIKEITDDPSCFSSKDMTIYWNPDEGIETSNNVYLSPATILNHEADHALQRLLNPEQKRKDSNTKDLQYKTKEEKRVIMGSEQITAMKHGEIKHDQKTQENHEGIRYKTTSPITNEHLYKLEVIGHIKKK